MIRTALAGAIMGAIIVTGTVIAIDFYAAQQGRVEVTQTAKPHQENTESFWQVVRACEDSDGVTVCVLFDENEWTIWPAGADTDKHLPLAAKDVIVEDGLIRVHVG